MIRTRVLGSVGLALLAWSPAALAETTLAGGQIVNQTWTQAGSPYIVQGDLVVPAGAFLHIESGVEVQIATGDLQASVPDTARVAISIQGALQINGTEAEPVTVHAQTGSAYDTWHGLIVESSATEAKVSWTKLQHARYGVEVDNALAELYACELANNQYHGVLLKNGAALFDRMLVRDMQNYGVRVDGGSVTMNNVIATDNGNYGFFLAGGTVSIFNSLAHGNTFYGLSCTGANVNVVNTLVTQNGTYGVYRQSGVVNVSYSDVWGNLSSNVFGSVTQTSNISTNPQYVNPTLSNYRLQASSVCIDSGTSGGAPDHDYDNVVRPLNGDGINAAEHDIGPFEFVAMPICGDSQLNGNETCDDGAANGTYGFCNATCTGPGPYCGDNSVDAGEEECDDGNTTSGDGCDAQCNDEGGGSGGSGTGGNGSGGNGSGGNGSGGNGSGGNGSGGNGSGGNGSGANGGPCVPGEQVACACPNGSQGAQSCNAEGTGFDTCGCADNNASEADSGCAVGRPNEKPSNDLALLALAGLALGLRRRRG